MKMKVKNVRRLGCLLGTLGAILVYLAVAGVSWLIICGIVKLVTLCFGWAFSWAWATGIWLIMVLLSSLSSK